MRGHEQALAPEHHAGEAHEAAETAPRRTLDDFQLDPGVIEELTGRAKARFRGLTRIRGLSGEIVDPIVETALAKLRDKYSKGLDAKRKKLAEKYLDAAEAVTARLNRQALPRTTRLLLAVEGVYETLLLKAIQEGVGRHADETEAAGGRAQSKPTQQAPVAGD
jgi:hypothetical protein